MLILQSGSGNERVGSSKAAVRHACMASINPHHPLTDGCIRIAQSIVPSASVQMDRHAPLQLADPSDHETAALGINLGVNAQIADEPDALHGADWSGCL